MWAKSSRSASGNCVEFRKSTRSANNGCCVEVADAGPIVVRDSKNPDGSRLAFTEQAWTSFLAGIRTGVFE